MQSDPVRGGPPCGAVDSEARVGVSYLSSAPAAGRSHSGLLPSTVAGPRGHRRRTRNCGLRGGKQNA